MTAATKSTATELPTAAPIARKPLGLEAVRIKSEKTGEDLFVATPAGVTHDEVISNALVYFSNVSHMLNPGQLLHLFSDDNAQYTMLLLKMVVGGRGTGLRHIELIPLISKTIGAAVDVKDHPTRGYVVDHTPLHGWHVRNVANGVIRPHNLPSRQEAEKHMISLNANQPQ